MSISPFSRILFFLASLIFSGIALAQTPYPIPWGVPDLTVSSFSAPQRVQIGQPLGALLNLEVMSLRRAWPFPRPVPTVSTFVDVRLSDDAVIDATDPLLLGGRESVQNLKGGERRVVPVASSATLPAGTVCDKYYYLGVHIDPFDTISELSESNNARSQRIFVDCGIPYADLASMRILGASGGTVGYAKLVVGWTYGEGTPPAKLFVTVWRDGQNVMPSGQAQELPGNTNQADVIIWRLFQGTHQFEVVAEYADGSRRSFTFAEVL